MFVIEFIIVMSYSCHFWDILYFTLGIFWGKALDVFIDFEH